MIEGSRRLPRRPQEDGRRAGRAPGRPAGDATQVLERRRGRRAVRLRDPAGAPVRVAARDDVALAADGKTNRKGMPNPVRLAVIAQAHFDTVRLPFPPALAQQIGLALGAPLGRALGYRATYAPEALPVAATARRECGSGSSSSHSCSPRSRSPRSASHSLQAAVSRRPAATVASPTVGKPAHRPALSPRTTQIRTGEHECPERSSHRSHSSRPSALSPP